MATFKTFLEHVEKDYDETSAAAHILFFKTFHAAHHTEHVIEEGNQEDQTKLRNGGFEKGERKEPAVADESRGSRKNLRTGSRLRGSLSLSMSSTASRSPLPRRRPPPRRNPLPRRSPPPRRRRSLPPPQRRCRCFEFIRDVKTGEFGLKIRCDLFLGIGYCPKGRLRRTGSPPTCRTARS